MNIIFYKLQDEVNDVKKLKTLTATATYEPMIVQGTLKAPTSKIAPVIEFGQDITYFNGYNYCYIADFGRYYFVDNVVSVRVSVTSISLRVDVLTSFLTQASVDNLPCIVGRSANPNVYSELIPDKRIQFKIEPDIRVYEPTDYSINNSKNITFNIDNPTDNIIVSITDIKTLPQLEDITVPNVLRTYVGTDTIDKNYFRPVGNSVAYVTDLNDTFTYQSNTYLNISVFLNWCAYTDDSQTYVNSIMVYPFAIPKEITKKDIHVKDTNVLNPLIMQSVQMYPAKTFNSGFLILKDFTLELPNVFSTNKIDFMKFEPYTTCEIYIPYVSWVKINLKETLGHRLLVYYNVDYITGKGSAYLFDATREGIIYQTNCQLGVEIPVNTTNMKENEIKSQNYTRNYITGLISSVGIGLAGAVTENPVLISAGISGVIATSAQFINNENLLLDRAKNPSYCTDGISGAISGLDVLIRVIQVQPTTYSDGSSLINYKEQLGLPSNKTVKYSDLIRSNEYHTYTELIDLHISKNGQTTEYLNDITYNEIEELKKLCTEGIYV